MARQSHTPFVGETEARVADPALKMPALYKVVLLNDDYTPMNFVVVILEKFFFMSVEQATEVMLEVHNKGKGICGVFSLDVAKTKVLLVSEYAKSHDHPLLCRVEPN